MGRLITEISQKSLDLEYNKAKIIASPYDYKFSERIIVREHTEYIENPNIFRKKYHTEENLCEALELEEREYMGLHPQLVYSQFPTDVKDITKLLGIVNADYEWCVTGFLCKYNNLNVDEDVLLHCLSPLYSVKAIHNQGLLNALEVLHLRSVAKSSLIPNLMYFATEFEHCSLQECENIEFATVYINNKVAPLLQNFRYERAGSVKARMALATCILPSDYYNKYLSNKVEDVHDVFYKLGLIYTTVYGVELLYHFSKIEDQGIKNNLIELFQIGYLTLPNTFCMDFLYHWDNLNNFVINQDVQDCFDDDTESRFKKIHTYLGKVLPTINNFSVTNWDYYKIPTIFAALIADMHSWAYQQSRVKHAMLLYQKAKSENKLNVDDLEDSDEEIIGNAHTPSSSGGNNPPENELLNLDFLANQTKKINPEDSEKNVGPNNCKRAPSLTTMDAIAKDLKNSKYRYEIKYINSTNAVKSTYDMITSQITMLIHELTRQIREIRTYNTGGKHSGLLVGKIDKKNLYKYKTDPHIFCNNSYKQKEMDLAFGCILDQSGSMGGEKIKNGRIVMIMLHEVLSALSINHSIIGHTADGWYKPTIFKYCQFKEEANYTLAKPYDLAKATDYSCNCDSGALYYMQQCMKHVRNRDKIVIIFSDGQPTECTGADLVNQVRRMERSGIHVIGVGINFEEIKDYYPDYANGRNLKEMTDIVVSILKRYVLQKKD